MILVAGAGAMAEAAKAMRRIQQDLNRRVNRFRNNARNRVKYAGEYEPNYMDFPCAELCGTCGYLVDELPADKSADSSCPACGDAAWIDLSLQANANRVHEMEAQERNTAPRRIKLLVLGATIGLIGLVLAGLVIASYQTTGHLLGSTYLGYAMVTGFASIFVVPLAYYALPRPVSVWLLQGRQRTPHRWHVPFPLPDPDHQHSRSFENLEAEAVDETLEAPISGRECLAYQVCVLFDIAGDARPPEWALQEQRAESIRLGGELDIPPEALFLESPVEPVGAPGSDDEISLISVDGGKERSERYEDIKQFLRQRGLFVTDGEFHFFEARLEPGDCVDVADHDGEVYVVRHSSAAQTDDLPELPALHN